MSNTLTEVSKQKTEKGTVIPKKGVTKTVVCTDENVTAEMLEKYYYAGYAIAGITHRLTHYGPHGEELGAGFILEETEEGRTRFPGIEHSAFAPVSMTQLRTNGLTGRKGFFEAMSRGFLLLGVGGGPLDEHGDRQKNISCVERVVRLIGLKQNPNYHRFYKPLIEFMNYEDNNGDNLIKILNKVNPEDKLSNAEIEVLKVLQTGMMMQNFKKGFEYANSDPEIQAKIIAGAMQNFRNEVEQAKLFSAAFSTYGDCPKNNYVLEMPQVGQFQMLEIQSDNPFMNKVVHSKRPSTGKDRLGILLLHKTNGQFVIMPSPCISNQHKEKMREILKMLRIQVALNTKRDPIDPAVVGNSEIIEEIPELHFAESTGIISNGSKVDPDVPGLIGVHLTVDAVIQCIKDGLCAIEVPKN